MINFNFMRMEDVTMSGQGFEQSMAFHAYLSLPLASFVAQCLYCVSSIVLAYVIRSRMLRWLKARSWQSPLVQSLCREVGPAAVVNVLMGAAMVLGDLFGWGSTELMVVWKVLALTVWVWSVRLGSWVLRQAMSTHGLLRFLIWLMEWVLIGAFVLTFFGLLQPLGGMLDGIRFSIGAQVFKGTNILGGVCLALVAFALSGQVAKFVEWGVHQYSLHKGIEQNDGLMLTRLFSVSIFLLTAVGVLISSGIESTTLAAFAGALGIGLGFGLQDMVVNFIAGLYILLERAMKVGDYITLNHIHGRVVHLGSRAIVVRESAGTESLIPNSSVTKGVLRNHTLSNADYRISFVLKIAEAASIECVQALTLDALLRHPRVLGDHPMAVLVTSVLEDEVCLEVSCWINDMQNGLQNLVSDLFIDIARSMRQQGVFFARSGGT